MSDIVTIRGFIASDIRSSTTTQGHPVASFRLGSTERKFDKVTQEWADGETNWYTVTMFRALAQNVLVSVNKGERVIVTGKLKLRQWSNEADGRRGISPEVEAESIGHDLSWGTTRFQRSNSQNTAVATGSATPTGAEVSVDAASSIPGSDVGSSATILGFPKRPDDGDNSSAIQCLTDGSTAVAIDAVDAESAAESFTSRRPPRGRVSKSRKSTKEDAFIDSSAEPPF